MWLKISSGKNEFLNNEAQTWAKYVVCLFSGHLYVQSDVYGFGVVLLEMMTGLRAFDTKRPNGKQKLTDWVKPILSQRRKLKPIMDARIDGQYSSKVLSQVSQLALRCLEDDPRKRPSMTEVVELLEQIEVTKPKNRPVH